MRRGQRPWTAAAATVDGGGGGTEASSFVRIWCLRGSFSFPLPDCPIRKMLRQQQRPRRNTPEKEDVRKKIAYGFGAAAAIEAGVGGSEHGKELGDDYGTKNDDGMRLQ